MQRLVVGLVAVYAVRATAVRRLTLEDLDFRWRRIRIAGTSRLMPDLVHQLLRTWLTQRRRKWPHTGNRHVLLSHASAAGTAPVGQGGVGAVLARLDRDAEVLSERAARRTA